MNAVRTLYQAAAEGAAITLDASAPDKADIVCDKPLVERVLMNLTGNALKFTPKGGRITIGATTSETEIHFWVQDSGPGIPADKLEAIFEKFKQLDRDTAARAGYGLGLSICKKIVEVHGGKIWVESKEGHGSRFAFSLPKQPVKNEA